MQPSNNNLKKHYDSMPYTVEDWGEVSFTSTTEKVRLYRNGIKGV